MDIVKRTVCVCVDSVRISSEWAIHMYDDFWSLNVNMCFWTFWPSIIINVAISMPEGTADHLQMYVIRCILPIPLAINTLPWDNTIKVIWLMRKIIRGQLSHGHFSMHDENRFNVD